MTIERRSATPGPAPARPPRRTWRAGSRAIMLAVAVSAFPLLSLHLAQWVQRAHAQPARPLAEEEGTWIQAVNAYRRHNNLPELVQDERLHHAALSHSADMLLN